jgi:hypothetical protein
MCVWRFIKRFVDDLDEMSPDDQINVVGVGFVFICGIALLILIIRGIFE